MLVMDGERFGGLARDVGGTLAALEQLTPVSGRLVEPPGTARHESKGAQGRDSARL